MNFALLAPFGLVALAALAIPLLIHLVRRIELRPTEFAALRWIGERVRPRRRIRFERPWLLLLRLVLLAALALLLARPVLHGDAAPVQAWVAVAPGVDRAAARAAVSDAGAELHWLAPGFPSLDEPAVTTGVPLASLLRELDAQLPAAVTLDVVVPDELAGLDGERAQLRRAVGWHVVAGRMPEAAPAPPPRHLVVRYAPDRQDSVRWLRAAVSAWNVREPGRYQLDAQPQSAAIPADADWLVWLAPQMTSAAEDWLRRGGVVLRTDDEDASGDPLWRDANGAVLARMRSDDGGRVIGLPRALVPERLPMLLDADFPDRLLAALRGSAIAATQAPTRAPAEAVAPRQRSSLAAGPVAIPASARPLDPWLAIAIALLFLAERLVATHRRKEVSP